MIETLDARARRWPRPLRWLYAFIKWTLAGMGAYMLVGHFVLTWGWFAGLWFFIAPLLHGLSQGLRELPPET
jgi:hypothetical protein